MSLFQALFRRVARVSPPSPEAAVPAEPPAAPQPPAQAQPIAPLPPSPSEAQIASLIASALAQAVQPKRFPELPGSDPAVLAEAGRAVCARLDALPSARKLPGTNIDIYVVRDFLSPDECTKLVALIDGDVKPSTILTGGGNARRTSQTCRLSSAEPLVAEVERRMVELLELPLSHSETVQGQRYAVGQQFKMHNDYVAGGQPYSEAFAGEGGQRTWTAMVFLNEPEAGGFTNFPYAQVKVGPEPGMLLAWNNNGSDGLSNPYTHHEGMIVEAGLKYILTKWFREREWQTSSASDALRV